MHLTRASIKASFWLTSYNFISKGFGLAKAVLLARLLTPTQFGYWGFVSLSLNLIETFTETGAESALIQKKDISRSELSAGWTIFLVRSIFITIVLFLAAPLIALFFKAPHITPYIQVIAFTPILRSLRNPALVLIKKRLEFHKEFLFLSGGSLVEVVTAIAATSVTRDVWGIVWSIVAGALAEVILSYLIVKPIIPTKFSRHEAKDLLNYGKWIWGGSLLSYIITQGDDIVVGKLLGASALGFYQYAYKIASLPATQITGVVTKVTFPAFSIIQDDRKRLQRAFKKTFWLTTVTTSGFSVLIAIFAYPLVKILLGEQWLSMVPALRILCIFDAIRASSSVYGPLLNAIGKPQLGTLANLIKAVSMFALIFSFTMKGGIEGTAWANVISSIITLIIFFSLVRKTLKNEMSSFAARSKPAS